MRLLLRIERIVIEGGRGRFPGLGVEGGDMSILAERAEDAAYGRSLRNTKQLSLYQLARRTGRGLVIIESRIRAAAGVRVRLGLIRRHGTQLACIQSGCCVCKKFVAGVT